MKQTRLTKATLTATCVAGAALATTAWSFTGGPAAATAPVIGPATVNAATLPLYFTSPTGNTICSLRYTDQFKETADCAAPKSTYTTFDPQFGRCRGIFSIGTGGKPSYSCTVGDFADNGNLAAGPNNPGWKDWYYGSRPQYVAGDHTWIAPVLENGSTVQYGQLRCTIDASKVRCWDSKATNHWFEFGRTSYRLSTGAHS